jgi:hypothetical protein
MFTHKQAWRRQRNARSSERTNRFEANKIYESLKRSTSLPNFSSQAKQSLDYSAPLHHTMGDLTDKKKCVQFSDNSKVVLIPCRGEYEKHGLMPEIWWEPNDYSYFKASARLEVMDLLERYKG